MFNLSRRLSLKSVSLFLRQISIYLAAGIPLFKACELLEISAEQRQLRHLILEIEKNLLTGASLSQCFSYFPHYFDALVLDLIKAGEQTGRLDQVLIINADYYEQKLLLKKRIQNALFYPALVAFCASITIIGMLFFVIPRFALLYSSLNTPLPAFTEFLLALSQTLSQHLILCSSMFTGMIATGYSLSRVQPLQRRLSGILWKIPGLKTIKQKFAIFHFIRHLTLTYSAGVALISALNSMQKSHHQQQAHLAQHINANLHAGMPLYLALETTRFFPQDLIQLIKVGETSGTLAQVLQKIVDFYAHDIDNVLKQLCNLIEPMVILGLGLVIAAIIIGLYLPILQLGNAM